MKRSRLLTIALSVLTLLAVAVPTRAAEPANADVFGCVIFQGGETTVPRRTDINLRFGWATDALRQSKKFLDSAQAYARIDGVKVAQPNQYWARPVQIGDEPGQRLWLTWWSYPAGQLARGESLVIEFQLTLRERHWDGQDWYEAGRVFGPGNRFGTDTPLKCTISAS